MSSKTPQWATPKEAASALGLHVNTVYRLLERGEIPGRRFGRAWRIPRSFLDSTALRPTIAPTKKEKS